jgi:hypothetical protein
VTRVWILANGFFLLFVINFSDWLRREYGLSFILILICWDGLGFGSRVWISANELVGFWYLIFRFF